jgi:hypothetical protein
MLLIGYLAYLAMIFIPGLGIGEALSVWKVDSSLMERLGVAAGLGISFDTVILFVKTSGVSLFGLRLIGIDMTVIYEIIGAGLVILAASLVFRRRFSFFVRPVISDLAILAVILVVAGMIAAFFAKYPIFPEYESTDFGNHVLYSTGLIAGTTTSLPAGLLYYGVEYQLAASILLVGGPALVTVRYTMVVLVLLSPIFVYLASVTLFNSRIAAILATVIFGLTATLWFDSVFNAGLYANFFGFIACLFLLTAFLDLTNTWSVSRWAVYIAALLMAYLSHYSTLTLLPALLIAGLIEYLLRRKDLKRYVLPGVIPLLPAGILLAAYPQFVTQIITVATGQGGAVVGSTAISAALSSIPVLSYLVLEIYDDLAFVVFLILACVYIYKTASAKNGLLFIPVFWILALLLTSPENIGAWRFSFMIVLPLMMMAGMAVAYLMPKNTIIVSKKATRDRKTIFGPGARRAAAISVLIIILLVVGSWGTTMLSDSFTGAQVNSTAQNQVYQAIVWLGNNTAPGSVYLSVSDWRFTYTGVMIDRSGYYQLESTPQQAIPEAQSLGAGYIIVTNLVTASLPANPSLFPWNNFKPSSNLTMVYSNPDVEIFKIV